MKQSLVILCFLFAIINTADAQVYEWMPWTMGMSEDKIPEGHEERFEWLKNNFLSWSSSISDEQRASLEKWYGHERAAEFEYAESFEIAEYGRNPSEEEIRMIFPMLN